MEGACTTRFTHCMRGGIPPCVPRPQPQPVGALHRKEGKKEGGGGKEGTLPDKSFAIIAANLPLSLSFRPFPSLGLPSFAPSVRCVLDLILHSFIGAQGAIETTQRAQWEEAGGEATSLQVIGER